MTKTLSPEANYKKTLKSVGFISLPKASLKDWKRIGFKSGLEIHQQLNTSLKLFCRCPAGIYHDNEDYDGEIIRHMRPTLSEMGEYDGTALMEFRTKKQIFYRLNNQTACTYEIDDTPPFKINKEALNFAIEISLLSNLNMVGEVHITRKQYLDGSIPTGFQRTAIIGVEGEIQLSNKKVRLIQLSLEEDSCREISDVGHTRVYKTDRLGMPLIETVTYPDMETPYELREAAEHIRFLNRSTGKVRTGIGSGREDVNVSCKGGTRVEIKGVAHNKWIPRLSHIEAFRQYALLAIRKELLSRDYQAEKWKISTIPLSFEKLRSKYPPIVMAKKSRYQIHAVNLPGFAGLMSHFTQPGKCFANEISDRLKVIACIEKPNLTHSESFDIKESGIDYDKIRTLLGAHPTDAQIIFWGPKTDIPTALETIEERCQMAFSGVPNETRKGLPDGTTIFERVLPGADRMYPDTDSAPIPLDEKEIEEINQDLPLPIHKRFEQMKNWEIPEDTFHYLLKKNLVQLLESINKDLGISPKWLGIFMGHHMKHLEGQKTPHKDFSYQQLHDLFAFITRQSMDLMIAKTMLPIIMEYPNMDMDSVLISLKFKKRTEETLLAPVGFLVEKFKEIRKSENDLAILNWLMGQIRNQAIGNISPARLSQLVQQEIEKQ
ncbi:MAG: Glu-tRNA(Gln) amidotransferase subunit GatE [Bacteroidetes bacterium]|nr:Glu-tRNA(Gln) amidotransferase subunit GatE [Bacteroidota bacterium]